MITCTALGEAAAAAAAATENENETRKTTLLQIRYVFNATGISQKYLRGHGGCQNTNTQEEI
jgi:hypothetical protein